MNCDDNMSNQHKWYFVRQGGKIEEHQLKEGQIRIGRNRTADIITLSSICSRLHCTVNLGANDNITIKNESDNGVYVNSVRSDECELKEGDIIGLGCDETVLQLQNDTTNNFYVFKLVKRNMVLLEPISLLSDEEEDIDESANRTVNRNADEAPVAAAPHVGEEILDEVANEPNNVTPIIAIDDNASSNNNNLNEAKCDDPEIIDLDNDENEFMFSQQCIMQLKQEAVETDETPNQEGDFQINTISDEDSSDNEENTWMNKLSQDQDKTKEAIIKKVTESTNIKKRKSVQLIEPVPEKKRKGLNGKQTLSSAISMGNKNEPMLKSLEKEPSNVLISVSTSRIEAAKQKSASSDESGPETLPESKISENHVSFSEALKSITIPNTSWDQKKKHRVAHTPNKEKKKVDPTIIKKTAPKLSKKVPSKHKVKRVRFADDPKIRGRLESIKCFEPEQDEDREIIVAPSLELPSIMPSTSSNTSFNPRENDPLDTIISDVTEWNTLWLNERINSPPINGIDFVVTPLMDQYPNFAVYEQIIKPLLKHELWSSIQAETRSKNRFRATITSMTLAMRTDRNRYVFHAKVDLDAINAKIFVGDFVLIETSNHPSFFAYVGSQQFIRSGHSKTSVFSAEASERVVPFGNGEESTIHVTPIANIRTELKQFNAIFHLQKTPFKEYILHPTSYRQPDFVNCIQNFNYVGYEPLNEEQLKVLKSVYNKCLNGIPNVSLIEGPPGTGKTRMIVSMILQLLLGLELKKKLRILVLTSSNAAIDIIARKLIHIKEKMPKGKQETYLNVVRYGVLNSMHPSVREIAPQYLIKKQVTSPQSECNVVNALKLQRDQIKSQIEIESKNRKARVSIIGDNIDAKRKRLQQIEDTIARRMADYKKNDNIEDVMANARVVCSTLSSSINLKPFIQKFDVCFIDEASQCTEPWSLVPLQYNIASLILVGDSKQLSPVILSQVCRDNCMERSLFTRLYDLMSQNELRTNTYSITEQYRMHPDICHFPNKYFYNNRLKSAKSTICKDFGLNAYNVLSLDFKQSNEDAVNYHNSGEAQFVVDLLKVTVKLASPEKYSYGVITPYAKQKAEIQSRLQHSKTLSTYDFPVNTIDSYQGQEKDIIILSTARTTGVGFLANPQRLNVALTRAKKCLIICGNFTSIANIRVWKELLADASIRKKRHMIPSDYTLPMVAEIIKKRMPAPQPSR